MGNPFFSLRVLAQSAWDFGLEKSRVVPWPLKVLWQCDRYRCLPSAGGLLDQDSHLMGLMGHCEYFYHLSKKELRKYSKDELEARKWLTTG